MQFVKDKEGRWESGVRWDERDVIKICITVLKILTESLWLDNSTNLFLSSWLASWHYCGNGGLTKAKDEPTSVNIKPAHSKLTKLEALRCFVSITAIWQWRLAFTQTLCDAFFYYYMYSQSNIYSKESKLLLLLSGFLSCKVVRRGLQTVVSTFSVHYFLDISSSTF